jgi:hypothetical protein
MKNLKKLSNKNLKNTSSFLHDYYEGDRKLVGYTGKNNEFVIYETKHVRESRTDLRKNKQRNHGLSSIFYEELFEEALKHGLTSFRGKECVIVWKGKLGYDAMIVNLKDNNDINIVTAFTESNEQDFHKCFIKEHNRIHLWWFS